MKRVSVFIIVLMVVLLGIVMTMRFRAGEPIYRDAEQAGQNAGPNPVNHGQAFEENENNVETDETELIQEIKDEDQQQDSNEGNMVQNGPESLEENLQDQNYQGDQTFILGENGEVIFPDIELDGESNGSNYGFGSSTTPEPDSFHPEPSEDTLLQSGIELPDMDLE